MSRLITKPQFFKRAKERFRQQRLKIAGEASGLLIESILDNTPVEDGHAHQAWSNAASQLLPELGPHGNRLRAALGKHSGSVSGSPEAQGFGSVDDGKDSTRVLIKNALGFVKTLEQGGVIRPIAPGGRKAPPVAKRPGEKGPLFGSRESEGRGMVFWLDSNGRARFAPTRTVPRGNFVKDAIRETKRRLKPLKTKNI